MSTKRLLENTTAMTTIGAILYEVGVIAFPGAFDTLSARIAQRSGFPMAFISGYSVAASLIGQPDMGLLNQTEMIQRARQICDSVDIPMRSASYSFWRVKKICD